MAQPSIKADASIKVSGKHFYRPELDVLRFAAFLGVFWYHAIPHEASAYVSTGQFGPWIAAVLRSGAFGVDLFFALSAYLITSLLLREKDLRGSLDVKSFYLRRILRIWPLYFAFLAFAISLKWLGFRTQQLSAPYIAGYALLAGNWIYVALGLPHSVTIPLWSVSIEEQFYLLWPLAVRRCSQRMIASAAGMLLVVPVLISAALLFLGHGTLPGYVFEYNTFVRMAPIALGILLALSFKDRMPPLSASQRIALFSLAATVWIVVSRYCEFNVRGPASVVDNLVGRPAIALASVAMLAACLGSGVFLVNRVTIYLGKISYGLYVIHEFGLLFAIKLVGQHRIPFASGVGTIAGLAITIIFAAMSYHWLEQPFLLLKSRYTYVASRPVEAALPESDSTAPRNGVSITPAIYAATPQEREFPS